MYNKCFLVFIYFSLNIFSLKGNFDLKKIENKTCVVPLAIIGGGPAGLCAALYGARAKVHSVIFMGAMPGGQLTTTSYVENWPGVKRKLGWEIMKELQEQAEEFGAVIKYDNIEKVEFDKWPFILHTSSGNEINALAVIIATGAYPRKLSIPGEEEYWAKGVSSCAVCDSPFFKDKIVYVVGGGDSAIEYVMNLSSYSSQVTMLVRSERMRAAARMQEKLKEYPNVKILYNKTVTQIIGDKNKVTELEILDTGTKKKEKVIADGLFLAIGQIPNNSLFRSFLKVNSQGFIQVHHPTTQTSLPGVFAAGDVEDPDYKQAAVALGSGCKAALDAISFLHHIGITEMRLKRCNLLK